MNELKPEDVMKALKICDDKTQTCEGCPYIDHCSDINKDALTLLREKDAKIERLTEERDKAQAICVQMGKLNQAEIAKARAEAITEFTEKLKERMREVYPADIYDSDIDQITNELKEEPYEQM